MLYTMCYASPVGSLLLAEKNEKLVGLWLEGQRYFLGSWKEERMEKSESAVLRQAKTWLDCYFKGERPSIHELNLAPVGSEYQKEVWKILCEIPYGEVTTYGEIAEEITARRESGKTSARAVGNAISHNPISIIIPCHRVMGADGSLTGYAGGVDKKIKLLAHEGVDLKRGGRLIGH